MLICGATLTFVMPHWKCATRFSLVLNLFLEESNCRIRQRRSAQGFNEQFGNDLDAYHGENVASRHCADESDADKQRGVDDVAKHR